VTEKRIVSLSVVKPGSNPDVDSDFNTLYREKAFEHVAELYGERNVANIGTFVSLKAKGAFKAMCTIYQVPFAQAGKIASLIPGPIEGVEATVDDLYNPASSRYSEGADFRTATAGEEWATIISGVKGIEGRNRTTSVHAAGVVMSSVALEDVIPLLYRPTDGKLITQWKYEELEALGLIKMDFLGLDTVDLIQHTVENIQKSGQVVPNMVDLIHGKMDDAKTYQLFQAAETVGIFQFGSDMVRALLKQLKPDRFNDLAACTAIARPGPMGMQSHVKYADRKNGREKMEYPVHPDFKGSALEDILGDTYSLVVYQEQIIQIANRIAGMTLQEGDDLRKAMGKKLKDKMMKSRPKFFAGAQANGFSDDAINELWDTIEEFAKYGFNKAHSVAYAMNAYQAAYLKANYPVEFMAALIEQNVGRKEKILAYLQEARRMGLKMGTVDINASDLRVSPNTVGGEYDIVYGLAGINGVSADVAQIIVDERKAHGLYKSPQDLINRCQPLGISNKGIYESLALAGAFDSMGVTRRGVVSNLPAMLNEAKNKKTMGTSLFDMFGAAEATEAAGTVDLAGVPEFPFVEKLQKEAGVIGLYITSHPLANVGPGLSKMRSITIHQLVKAQQQVTVTIAGSITDIMKKPGRNGGKMVKVTIDDGTGYITASLSKSIIASIDKKVAQDKLRKLYEAGEGYPGDAIADAVVDPRYLPMEDVEKNSVYTFSLTFRPGRDDNPYNAMINLVKPLRLADSGALPIRIRLVEKKDNQEFVAKMERGLARNLGTKLPGDYPIHMARYRADEMYLPLNEDYLYRIAVEMMENGEGLPTAPAAAVKASGTLIGKAGSKVSAKAAKAKTTLRSWPPQVAAPGRDLAHTENEVAEFIESLTYQDTGYTTGKTSQVEQAIEKYVGVEGYDFGVFDPDILKD
jgi:DNA polymerase-3 subunit alpha